MSTPANQPQAQTAPAVQQPVQIGLTADGAPIYAWPQPAPVAQSPAVPAPVRDRPTVHISPGTVIAGTGAVLIIGTVLVSMLLAVAITAASVAVCAVVLRKMLDDARKH